MARSFLSSTFALATATLVLLGAWATPVLAQPVTSSGTKDTTSPPPNQNRYPEVQQAVNLLLSPARDLPGATKLLEGAAKKYPELPTAHVVLYQIFAQLNQPGAARAQLELAVKNNPSDPEAYILLGNIALQERRLFEGSKDFDTAKQVLGPYVNKDRKPALEQQALSGIASLAEAREDWKEAENKLQDLLKLSPDEPNLVARQRLARALFWQGFAKEAYEVLKKAKAIDKETAEKNKAREIFLTPEAIMAQYYAQFEAPKTENAKIWFDASLKQAPNDLATRQVVAVWALENGFVSFAKEQAVNALRIEDYDAGLVPEKQKYRGSNVGHVLRGLVALWEKDWPEAEKDFQSVLLASPNDFVARNNIALALVEQDDPLKKQKALVYADNNRKDNPKSPDASSTLGWVYFRRGEFDLARLALDQAIQLAGGLNNADTATYAAHILFHQGNEWQARELLDGILKADRPFSMKKEAKELFEKVKDARNPNTVTPSTGKSP
jgi:tetratricopeptide (TPR) repeat protein